MLTDLSQEVRMGGHRGYNYAVVVWQGELVWNQIQWAKLQRLSWPEKTWPDSSCRTWTKGARRRPKKKKKPVAEESNHPQWRVKRLTFARRMKSIIPNFPPDSFQTCMWVLVRTVGRGRRGLDWLQWPVPWWQVSQRWCQSLYSSAWAKKQRHLSDSNTRGQRPTAVLRGSRRSR